MSYNIDKYGYGNYGRGCGCSHANDRAGYIGQQNSSCANCQQHSRKKRVLRQQLHYVETLVEVDEHDDHRHHYNDDRYDYDNYHNGRHYDYDDYGCGYGCNCRRCRY